MRRRMRIDGKIATNETACIRYLHRIPFLALSVEGELRVRELLAGQKHSSLILPLLRELLDEAGVELQDLDGIVFGMAQALSPACA